MVVTRTAKRKATWRWEWLVTAVEPVPREWSASCPWAPRRRCWRATGGGERRGGAAGRGHAAAVPVGAAIVAEACLLARACALIGIVVVPRLRSSGEPCTASSLLRPIPRPPPWAPPWSSLRRPSSPFCCCASRQRRRRFPSPTLLRHAALAALSLALLASCFFALPWGLCRRAGSSRNGSTRCRCAGLPLTMTLARRRRWQAVQLSGFHRCPPMRRRRLHDPRRGATPQQRSRQRLLLALSLPLLPRQPLPGSSSAATRAAAARRPLRLLLPADRGPGKGKKQEARRARDRRRGQRGGAGWGGGSVGGVGERHSSRRGRRAPQ